MAHGTTKVVETYSSAVDDGCSKSGKVLDFDSLKL